MQKAISILFACILFIQGVSSNDLEKKRQKPLSRFFNIETGVSHFTHRDYFTSSLKYDGFGASLATNVQRRFSNKIFDGGHQIDIGITSAKVSNAILFNYRYYNKALFKVSKYKSGNIYTGVQFDFFSNNRYHNAFTNNGYTYEWGANMSISARYEYAFNWLKKEFQWSYQPCIPILNYIYRPSYASSWIEVIEENETYGFLDILGGGKWMTLNKWLAFSNQTSIQMSINNNAIRVSYGWGLYNNNSTKESILAYHCLLFGLMVNI